MKKTKERIFKMISDPGHGWLSVSLKDIKEFDLADKISPYSYMSKNRAYLEEDEDASIFLAELKKRDISYSIKESHVDKTPIRNYAAFSKEKMDFAMSAGVGTEVFLYNQSEKKWNTPALIVGMDGKDYIVQSYSNKYRVSEYKLLTHTQPVPEEFKNTFPVISGNVKFNVRVVFQGDKYGRDNCLIHEGLDPLVEFFDSRYEHTKIGQFVSRYYASTLLQSSNNGLLLDTGTPDWSLSESAFRKVKFILNENERLIKDVKKSQEEAELKTLSVVQTNSSRRFNI